MKKFILKTVSVLLTIMLMISIIPVDCIKNGATAILDFSVKTKAADANDFSATFTNGLKYMDGNTANSFIGFIYNVRTDRVSDDMRSMGDIYRYLTGGFTKGTDEYEYAQFCFLITSEYFINKQTSIQSSYASQATNNLITFLKKKVGSDESGAQQLVNSELGKVKGYIKKVLYYAFDMQYDETIRNIDMVLSSYNNVTSVVDKVKKLVEAVGTTINTYYLISSTNSLKAYNYYTAYLNNRDIGTEQGFLEFIMNANNIGSVADIDSIPIFLEKLGFGNSWTSEDVQRVLRVFAEFTYHSRKEFSQLSEGRKPQDTHNHTTTFYQETDSSAIFICSSCGEKFYYEKYAYDFYDNRTEVSSGYSVLKYCKYIKLDATVLYPCKSVAKGAFSNRKYFGNIKTITIPEGYTTLGDDSFSGCWTVKDIYLPSTIKKIGKNAFSPNQMPINIHYAGTLEQWLSLNLSGEICRGYNLYINGKLVKDIYLNKSKINNYIFSGCDSIETIRIGSNVKSIGNESFFSGYGDTENKKVEYAGTVDDFYSLNIFGNIDDKNELLNSFYASELIREALYCNGEKVPYGVYYSEYEIDETVGNEGWSCSISHDYKGESIVIPNRLGQIKIKAFYGYGNPYVKSIKISNGIEIMDSNLSGKKLESISIPNSVKYIHEYTFDSSDAPNIKRIDYAGTIDEFYSLNIFGFGNDEDKNKLLTQFYVSEPIHEALYCNGERVPYGLYYSEYEIDKTVGEKGWNCFISHDYKGESIVIPNRLGQIKIKTFCGDGNPYVKSIKISNGIEIMDSNLSGKKLESISIPNSVKYIHECIFDNSSSYAPNIKRIDYAGTVDEFYSLNIFGYADNDFENAMEFYNSIIDLSVYCNNKLCTTKCWFENGKSYYVGAPIIENGEYTIPNKIGKYNITGIKKLICENGKKTLYIPKSIEHIGEIVNCNDVTVKCYMNSAAHKFALKNKIKFEILDSVSVKNDSKLVLDKNAGIIYGITGGKEQLRDSIDIPDNGSITFSTSNDRIGTGTIVYVLDSEKNTVSEITATIFGDVNGDGWYDGTDAITVSMIANGMLSREQVGEAVWMAADCNHDGVINQADVDLLNQAGVLLANVDQTKSPEELLETSAKYNEYLNLIDQSVAVEEKKQETEMPDSSSSNSGLNEKILMFAEYFINLILELFSKIF